ncbi:MAG: glycoside hydrolase family 95 protein, partial [Planctomycetes bacterium]|nr:glycoside hydrolase family 95 protein [Planctomycetota bacterium]
MRRFGTFASLAVGWVPAASGGARGEDVNTQRRTGPLGNESVADPNLRLWYRQPAALWNQALPVGNGRLGAMAHGGVEQELLQLNEETVWSGNQSDFDRVGAHRHLPEIRRLLFAGRHAEAEALVAKELLGSRPLGAYQPLGDLILKFSGAADFSDYHRELDLDTAIARVRFRQGDAVFTREVVASAPAQVLVVRLTCDRPGRLSLTARLSRKEGAITETLGNDGLVLRGQADQGRPTAGVRFAAQLRAVVEGGRWRCADGALHIESADAVTLLLSAATDFRQPSDLSAENARRLAAAAPRGFDALRAEHVADYRRLFRRVELDLGHSAAESLPTDERLERLKAGGADPGLAALYL